ncbi:acetolactate synthase small subunit [Christensenellaceae bacterium OttesenSCG-928-L17]|nr:acetolactate synthase small subunit [Christensenellaceae bacterium OttesenSCG-928-L17]
MKKVQDTQILTLMVANEFGVLTRITAQIRREGWNIKSLAVAECIDPTVSRITLSLECFDTTLRQVIYRLSRLACVHSVSAYEPDVQLCRELAIAKLPKLCKEVQALADKYAAQIIHQHDEGCVLELSGLPATLDEFIAALKEIGMMDVVRTGPIVLQ